MKKYLLIINILLYLGTTAFTQTKEKNGYVGILLGPSYPVSDFGDHSMSNENAIAEAGYMTTTQHFKEGYTKKFQTTNLNVGVGFRL